jgi:choline dehydrogenase-like flavoprotein
MIGDARHCADDAQIETDICLVGAGPAGLTLARAFANSRHRVCLLESGGRRFERRPQRLSRGTSTGQPYEPLDLCRVRQFGGTTGRPGWGGWCKPLAREDFEEREWVPMSGWPIAHDSLAPYYARAAQTLQIPADHDWSTTPLSSSGSSPELLSEPCALSPLPQFGEASHAELQAAPNVEVLLHATVLGIQWSPDRSAVETLRASAAGHKTFTIKARYFVLAAGGIENARLMLASNDHFPTGIGNTNDLVGRFFMEHPRIRWGHFEAERATPLISVHDPRQAQQALSAGEVTPRRQHPCAGLTLSPSEQAEHGILASRSWIKPTGPAGHGAGAQALQDLTFWVRKGRMPADILSNAGLVLKHGPEAAQGLYSRLRPNPSRGTHFSFDTIIEQEPQRENRVTLDTRVDSLGMPRPRLSWQLSPLVRRTLARTQQVITGEMRRLGYTCRSNAPDVEETPVEKLPVRWVRHHMGTTRMATNEREGVVDPNCRIFGVPNLFVAGSSVFPTAGNDMPTMTIIALAHRLADHLTILL